MSPPGRKMSSMVSCWLPPDAGCCWPNEATGKKHSASTSRVEAEIIFTGSGGTRFLPGMVAWLNETVALHVEIAAQGVQPRAGHVYLAPDGRHHDQAGRRRPRIGRAS